jgi:hypothetical protein
VLVEAGVLDGQHRVTRDLVDLAQPDDLSVLVQVQRGQDRAVRGEDRRSLGDPGEGQVDVRPDLLELVGELAEGPARGADRRQEGQGERQRAERDHEEEQAQSYRGEGERLLAPDDDAGSGWSRHGRPRQG